MTIEKNLLVKHACGAGLGGIGFLETTELCTMVPAMVEGRGPFPCGVTFMWFSY